MKNAVKPKYSVDKDNRLLAAKNNKNLSINGSFSTDKDNRLIYWLNEPGSWRKRYQLPEKIVFTGSWKLNSNYDLELELTQDKSDWQGDILTLKGEIISCESDKLVFEIKSVDRNGLTQVRLLKLTGIWAANESNQIYFSVSKKGPPDILTLQGTWRLNQNQQIIYTYQKTSLKRKDKILSTITFCGFWQITSAKRLAYILSSAINSKFDGLTSSFDQLRTSPERSRGTLTINPEDSRRIDFKVQLETPNLYPKEGVIKYRIGIGLKGLTPKGAVPKIICLYGTWKLSRRSGLSFDMEYAKGRIQALIFGAEVNFNKKNQIVFNLKNESGEKLGINVVFTHRFLRQLDAELFLRLKHAQQESGIDAGIRIPF